MSDIHPIIELFQAHAEVLDASGQSTTLDDAIVSLAAWLDGAQDRLTEDDMTVLADVGAIMYREGLLRRAGGSDS